MRIRPDPDPYHLSGGDEFWMRAGLRLEAGIFMLKHQKYISIEYTAGLNNAGDGNKGYHRQTFNQQIKIQSK